MVVVYVLGARCCESRTYKYHFLSQTKLLFDPIATVLTAIFIQSQELTSYSAFLSLSSANILLFLNIILFMHYTFSKYFMFILELVNC